MSELQASLDRLRHLIDLECFHHAVEESCIADIRAVLDAVPQWRPIETAPKDRAILGWSNKVEWDIYAWSTIAGQSFWFSLGPNTVEEDLSAQPTHWMPLPEPPTKEGR